MYPLNDNDLDRLSRDAAEHYDVESSATGWEALEKRLNRELPHKEEKDRKRFLFWLFFIAVMTGGTLIWMLNGNTPSGTLAQNKNAVNSTTVTSDNKVKNTQQDKIKSATADVASDNKSTSNPTAETVNTNNAEKKAVTRNQKASGNPTVIKSNESDDNNAAPDVIVTGRKKLIAAAPDRKSKNQETLITGKKTSLQDADKVVKDVAVEEDNDKTTNDSQVDAKKDSEQPVNNTAVAEEKAADKTENKPAEETKQAATETAVVKQADPKKAGKVKAPLELGFVIGPDQSNVKFKYTDHTGINIGLTVGYRLSDRWSLNTGLIYTKKNYKAAASDFTPPKHYWTNYVNLDNLQGNCSMLDIPLNVRYDFTTGKKRLFASTGLSTYLMNHQYYDYYYHSNTGQAQKGTWETDSNSHYVLSVVNLSLGFERSLGNHFSIQAEPYLKIPLKGVGFGSMQMNSYGIYFSLKYKPSFRAKQPTTKK